MMKHINRLILLIGLSIATLNSHAQVHTKKLTTESKVPSKFTKAYNKAYSDRLNWNNKTDFKSSMKGFVAGPDTSVILSESGEVVWDFNTWEFTSNLKETSPTSVNPSLWRMAKLNTTAGLFEVIPNKIYQIRNFDLSVMSFIIGKEGYIIVDPLISPETAKAGHKLFKEKVKNAKAKKLKAIIFTHSHVDHFGGVYGIIKQAGLKVRDVEIFAPKGFMDAAVSENVYAGNVMGQRAAYMYGDLIPKDTSGGVGSGLGKATSDGTVTIIPPTKTVDTSGTVLNIAGLNVEFIYAPNTEAPSEMLFYFSDEGYKAICAAEDASQTMHNLYTLRGAKTRNAKEWVSTLTHVMQKWGNDAQVEFNSHHWPVWGNDRIRNHLETQRAMYKYIHDQILHYANMGYDMTTIAEILNNLPQSLNQVWSSQGYYGTMNHNVKATWDLYLGWFNGTPSNLHKLPSNQSSPKYVALMGGSESILERAKKAYAMGEYRWVAELVQHVINTDTNNKEAKFLVADAYEQMGYQAVSGPWRNFYLTGAHELRNGRTIEEKNEGGSHVKDVPITLIQAMTLDMKFDMISIMIDAQKAIDKEVNFAIKIIDNSEESITAFQLKYACLNYLVDNNQKLDFTIIIDKKLFDSALTKANPFAAIKNLSEKKNRKRRVEIDFGESTANGAFKLKQLIGSISSVGNPFNIVTPNYPIPSPINPMLVRQK